MALWVLTLLACSGTSGSSGADHASTANVGPPDDTWLAEVALHPDSFADLMAEGRDGWIALHANNLDAADVAFADDRLARARVEWRLAILQSDLSRVQGLVQHEVFAVWDKRSGLPEGTAVPVVASLAAYCAGDDDQTWATRVVPGTPGSALIQQVSKGIAPWEAESDTSDPFVDRMRLHKRARNGDLTPLLEVAAKPILEESDPKGFTRRYYDPCLHRTLADVWLKRTAASLRGASWLAAGAWTTTEAGLGGRLFAPWLTNADLRSEVQRAKYPGTVAARNPSLVPYGAALPTPARDTAQAGRTEVRALDAYLADQRAALLAAADDDGAAVLTDLDLIGQFRQAWLTTRARQALVDDRPQQALAILELASDVSERGIGPRNSPELFALLAEARLRLGRTRSALDALQILSEARPEVLGLKESTNDLAILQGLDRQGDSKEN